MAPRKKPKYAKPLKEFSDKFLLRSKKLKKIKPTWIILLSFLALVLIGSLLLFLPFASTHGGLKYIDCLFLATSAVCVTGLSPVTLASELTVYGKIVMAILIQMGGLGLVTIISFFTLALRKDFKLGQAVLIREALNQEGFKGVRHIIIHIIIYTGAFELTGFLLTLPVFLRMPEYNVLQAIGISLFHSISAFNNAGFDIIGDSSLLAFSDNIYFNLVTCGLIIFGGIGFLVWDDIFFTRNPRKFSTQTKIVLITYFTILAVSFLSIWGLSQVDGQEMTWLEALSYSVNLRTAGFATIDTTKLGSGNLLLSQALMFIGGNPLSTAGGIKTTTIFVILATLVSFIRSKKTIVFRRRITQDTKIKAFLLFGFGVVAIIVGSAVIGVLNPAFTMEQITYEATSAFGTVGFSQGITPNLHWGSKLVLCFLMYTGRVSPVSYLSLFNNTFLNVPNDNIDYLDTDIMIG